MWQFDNYKFSLSSPNNQRDLKKVASGLHQIVRSPDLFNLTRKVMACSRHLSDQSHMDREWKKIVGLVEKSRLEVKRRYDRMPKFEFPDLPVSHKVDEIKNAIKNNQVLIIAGETGSGKTTQIPKICLEAGRGVRGLIGHTQPRRIAAKTVAQRISEELGSKLGDVVGYQVRFSDQSSPKSYIKLMTDGILLAEIQNDRYLKKYDTIIIDEAHERSLNIDFLLGFLKNLLLKRADLKVIITSATIDVEKFSEHFDQAPIVKVSGRTYPVEIVYSGIDIVDMDRNQAILECINNINLTQSSGDILVFLSSEREIRETSVALRREHIPHLDIVPLYARLSLTEQSKIFSPHTGRRVILSTNVAETSLTVPGIRFVVDTGRVRISRYSFKTKVQRLPIEAISQASANQRAGRCGRVSDGICYRLYEQKDFENRPTFTDPEIIRTNLAAVILQMSYLRLGNIKEFPFIDSPDIRLINDGYKLLEELRAIANGKLTPMGRKMVAIPLDPRLSRMLFEANINNCLDELVVIVSALSIQDPRERPSDKREAADLAHKQWLDKDSDFMTILNLWNHLEQQRRVLSGNQFARYCRKNFVSHTRMREWRDIHHQVHTACKAINFTRNKQASEYEAIHRALLSGLLGHIGTLNEKWEYMGTRNRKFFIFPASGLSKKPPKWLAAASLMETSKQYAVNVAKINPNWLESLASHLVKKTYSEPFYHVKSGQVMAKERQALYGLTILEGKQVAYGSIATMEARNVFIQQALVEGRYTGKGRFSQHNKNLVIELQELEDRFRRRDLLVEQSTIFNFYDNVIPESIYNLPAFEKWRKKRELQNSKLLYLNRDQLLLRGLSKDEEAQFPKIISFDDFEYSLQYHFQPGHERDGVTLMIPIALLHQLPRYLFEWLVPGMLRDKCIALIKRLPKNLRRSFVPVPDYVDQALQNMTRGDKSLVATLSEQLTRLTGVSIPDSSWNSNDLDKWYQMNFILLDDNHQKLAMARDLSSLQKAYRRKIDDLSSESSEVFVSKTNIKKWDFGDLLKEVALPKQNMVIKAWPAIKDDRDSVSIKLMDNPLAADAMSQRGQLRLALLKGREQTKYLSKNLLKGTDLDFKAANLPSREEVVDSIIMSSFQEGIFVNDAVIRQKLDFEQVFNHGIGSVVGLAQIRGDVLGSLLDSLVNLRQALRIGGGKIEHARSDIENQLAWLFCHETLMFASSDDIQQYPRFVKALNLRVEKLSSNMTKDKDFTASVKSYLDSLSALNLDHDLITIQLRRSIVSFRWSLEELRVSLFAQQLKTRYPVSFKRLDKKWLALNDEVSRIL